MWCVSPELCMKCQVKTTTVQHRQTLILCAWMQNLNRAQSFVLPIANTRSKNSTEGTQQRCERNTFSGWFCGQWINVAIELCIV